MPYNIRVFALLLALTVPTIASAGQADNRADADGKTIVLTGDHAGPGTIGLDTDIDEPSTDNGIGNRDIFSDDLRYENGTVAGRTSSVCTTTSSFSDPTETRPAYRGANLCTIGYVLFDRGKITVSGIVTDDDFATGAIVLPVVGGTGEFRNAHGEVETKFAPVFTDPATITFRLGARSHH